MKLIGLQLLIVNMHKNILEHTLVGHKDDIWEGDN
jgi:hypothetical protein